MTGAPARAGRGGVVLAIDAAPGVGSVAVVRSGEVLLARAVAMRAGRPAGDGHGPQGQPDDPLMPAVAAALREAGLTPGALDGVACGAGPGGFTGLRIAASIAKGIAHATGCALLAAPSLAWAAAVRAPRPGAWLVTLDALRGERYVARVELAETAGAPAAGMWAVRAYEYLGVHAAAAMPALAETRDAAGVLAVDGAADAPPIAAGVVAFDPSPVDLARWEPAYGRVAEAQARWEAVHGPLGTDGGAPA